MLPEAFVHPLDSLNGLQLLDAGPGPVTCSSPGDVGLSYSRALFEGNFDAATAYVLPRDRGTLRLLTTGLSAGSVRAQRLAVGSLTTQGNTATLIMTGRLCSSGAAPTDATPGAPRPDEQCVENGNPDSNHPAFRLELCRRAAAWYVCFPQGLQSSAGAEPAVGAISSVAAR